MPVVPQVYHSPADWRGAEIADSPSWRIRLTEAHRAELLAAVAAVEQAGRPLADIGPECFPLPTLGPVLEQVARDLAEGRGFALLSGVPVTGCHVAQCDVLCLGISGYLGRLVPQGPGRAPLLHVRDQGADPAAPTSKSYQHRGRLGYHAHPADVVGLLCIRPAKSGGLSSIVSAVAVLGEFVRSRPDLADLLWTG
jgi:hypothetical protein